MTFSGPSLSNVPRDIRHFRLLKKVGQGTFGAYAAILLACFSRVGKASDTPFLQSVYKAFDTNNSKLVAIKILEPKGDAERRSAQDEIQNLRTVHQAVSGMTHKPVVGLVDAFTYRVANGGELQVIVLEWMEFDLSALLELGSDRLSFSRSQLKCIMKQILEGLTSLSACGLMHRDLKVMNVLITASGHAKLGDLGSATSFVNRTRFSSEVCTLWYRAPELLLGCECYDHKVDVWSAAVVFVELCLCANFVRGNTVESQFLELANLFGVPSDLAEFKQLLGSRADEMVAWAGAAREATGDAALQESASQLWDRLLGRIGLEGVDLLKQMFSFNPFRRPSAQECLNHPFFSTYPSPAPRVLLPNGIDELHAFEHAASRLRKEQQQQSEQLQLLQQKRAEAQSVRKLSPDHPNVSVAEVLQSFLGVPKSSSDLLTRTPKRKKNLQVSFALDRNEHQLYCPADAPSEVSASRNRKRARPNDDEDCMLDDADSVEERPSKLQKVTETPAVPLAPFTPSLSSVSSPFSTVGRALPKLLVKSGQVRLLHNTPCSAASQTPLDEHSHSVLDSSTSACLAASHLASERPRLVIRFSTQPASLVN